MMAASVLLLVGTGLITVILLNRNNSVKEKALAARVSTLAADSIKPVHEKPLKDSGNNLSATELSTAKTNDTKEKQTIIAKENASKKTER